MIVNPRLVRSVSFPRIRKTALQSTKTGHNSSERTLPYLYQLSSVNKRMCSCGKAGESAKGGKSGDITRITADKLPTSHIFPRDTTQVAHRKFFATSSVQTSPNKMPGETAVLRFAKLTENAFAPTKGSDLAAGFDLKR